MASNILFVLYGPTCSGKTELGKLLIKTYGDRLPRIRSCTSRPRRVEKNEHEDAYHWLTRAEFEEQIAAGAFVEYDRFDGHLYGRRWTDFADLAKGPGFADMTESGLAALQAHEDFHVVSVKIDPRHRKPDKRIEERADDDEARSRIPVNMDHVIVNDHGDLHGLTRAFTALRKIIEPVLQKKF